MPPECVLSWRVWEFSTKTGCVCDFFPVNFKWLHHLIGNITGENIQKSTNMYLQLQLCASDVILSFYFSVVCFFFPSHKAEQDANSYMQNRFWTNEMTRSLLSVVLYVLSRLFVLNMICASAEPVTILRAVSTCHQDKLLDTEQDCDPEVWQNVVATKAACASSEITGGGVTEQSRARPVAFPVSCQRFLPWRV